MQTTDNAAKIEKATAAILRAARANHHITAAGLIDELERDDVWGWMHICRRYCLTHSDWCAAMQRAADALRTA